MEANLVTEEMKHHPYFESTSKDLLASAEKCKELDSLLRKYYTGNINVDDLVDCMVVSFASQPDLLRIFACFLPSDAQDRLNQHLYDTTTRFENDELPLSKVIVGESQTKVGVSCGSDEKCMESSDMDVINLHELCKTSPPAGTVIEFLVSNTEEASVQDKYGQTPLHVACKHGASYEIISALVKAFPDAISLSDNHGRIPFHYYLFRHSLVEKETHAEKSLAGMGKKCLTSIYDKNFIQGPVVKIFTSDVMNISFDCIKILCNGDLLMKRDNDKYTALRLFAKHCYLLDPEQEDALAKTKQIISALLDLKPPLQEYLQELSLLFQMNLLLTQ
eukprot:CAMPEP_0197822904 /NCGR_PEP_ID=MMETSP1437-20131217/217_1 /TAXON_ID=49252 ORGANISM="Eucampia antarctica, Strain CCMP1452" /NCGR_SAMPLE_ID=MMETSP1437 /ASSEMBLY_ACC=CAM_ASM_001096 /LENGTH=332 /DNA_ID=CAMNT_0043421787 /DNA_START=32 /DNA_END=1031 /DNA_ORIENTATION=-